jgi:formylglycine-generating enzyme required for sulfatase activity
MKALVQGLSDQIDQHSGQRPEDGSSEDGGRKTEDGGQGPGDGAAEGGATGDSGQGSEIQDLESKEGSGDGDIPGEIAEDTDIIELEDDVEEVEVLEDDDVEDVELLDDNGIEEIDELQGEDRYGDFGPQEGDGDPGGRSQDNHLDAIESGHDPLQPVDPQKARLLAETFNRSLAAMDKFYNQYIEFPGGTYTVGAETPKHDEIMQHTVSLAPFFMGKFPVTNALFQVFIENTGYITTAEKIGFGTVYQGRCQTITDPRTAQSKQIWRADITSRTAEGACWYQPSGPGSTIHNKRNHPVVQVSAHDALAFSAWTGKRLPLEAEWEAATRTIKANIFPWGNDMLPGACNIEEGSIGDTTPVDDYPDFENDAGIADALY